MKIIAALCWDGSKDKAISYMIIDDKYQVRCTPVIKRLGTNGIKSFEREAKEIIKIFFREIKDIQNGNNSKAKIEYKIVGHANPANQFHTQMHKPSARTEYVRKCFLDQFRSSKGNGQRS